MALTYTGTNGLFTRLGKIAQVAMRIATHQTDGTAGLKKELEDVKDEYDSSSLKWIAQIIDPLQIQLNAGANMVALQQVFQTTIIQQVASELAIGELTLDAALARLILDMEAESETILGSASTGMTGSIAGPGNIGNGVVHFSTKTIDGRFSQHLRTPSSSSSGIGSLECIVDAQNGAVPENSEIFRFNNLRDPRLDIRHPDWPHSPGWGGQLRVTNPSLDAQQVAGQNILTNSDFESFTGDSPNNWTLATGVAGTDFFHETTTVYRGTSSLRLDGNGATLHVIKQALPASLIKPRTMYMMGVQTRTSTSAAGVVTMTVKSAGGSDIGDNWNSVVNIMNGASTSFGNKTIEFDTPADVPGVIEIVVEATTAIGNGNSLYIDDVYLVEMPRINNNPENPGYIILPGTVAYVVGDKRAITTQVGNGTMASTFRYWLDRFCDMHGRGIHLPYATSSETIADSLIA